MTTVVQVLILVLAYLYPYAAKFVRQHTKIYLLVLRARKSITITACLR